MPNKMERFTQRARRVLSLAQEAAISLQSASIDSEHLLLGLVSEDDSIAARILSSAGIDGSQVEDLARAKSKSKPALAGPIDLSADSKATLELAVDEARRQGHSYIGSEHLLLGLLRLKDGAALKILRQLDVSPDQIRRQFTTLMPEQPAATARSAAPGPSRRVFASNIEYFLLRSTSRSAGQISHLPVELSSEVKDALEAALKEIAQTGFLRLEERHLLLGLLQNREGAVSRILLDTGIDLDEIIHKLRRPTVD